jgi:hypothetical protein
VSSAATAPLEEEEEEKLENARVPDEAPRKVCDDKGMSAEFVHSDVAVSGQVLVAITVVWRLSANTLISRKRRKATLEKRVTSFSDAAGTSPRKETCCGHART